MFMLKKLGRCDASFITLPSFHVSLRSSNGKVHIRGLMLKSSKLNPEKKHELHLTPIDKKSKLSKTKKNIDSQVMRLAKRMALSSASGIQIESRRHAEKLIQLGKVKVNGNIVSDVATNVTCRDLVTVDNIMLSSHRETVIFLAHKLKGELVTRDDPLKRPTIIDRMKMMGLPSNLKPVGRLDYNTSGLILFTNNGDLARSFELPKNRVPRVYQAFVDGEITQWQIDALLRGVVVDGNRYQPIKVKLEKTRGKKSWIRLSLAEGKNREVRKALAHVGLVVKELIRVQFGPYRLADLPKGSVLKVEAKGDIALKHI